MSTVEIILSLAVAALTAQVIILQRHYTDKLAEYSMLMNDLIDLVEHKRVTAKCFDKLKQKLFDSSQ